MADADQYTKYRLIWQDQILDDKQLTPMAQVIAFRIGRKFNRKIFLESGVLHAWPSYGTLAEETGCDAKTVQRAVLLLKKNGHILTEGSGGRHCSLSYFANIGAAAKGGHKCPPFEENEFEKVDISVPKGGHLKPEKVDTSVLQIPLKKSLKKSLNAYAPKTSFSKSTKDNEQPMQGDGMDRLCKEVFV